MFHTDRIAMALTVIPGNKPFTLDDFDRYFNGNGDVGALTRDQIGKAIRSRKFVKRTSKRGVYRLKGRRVMP